MVPVIRKSLTISRTAVRISTAGYVRLLWHVLIYASLLYNFHRYIFKYSHGGYPKEGYQQTPLIWQGGKFGLVFLLLSVIYLNSRFIKQIPVRLVWTYAFLLFALLVNVASIVFYQQVATDEIEYLLFAFMLLPIGFMNRDDLGRIGQEIDPIINVSQFIIIASNWIVIFNYFAFRIVPFHAYEGILLRFGGLWDDPNTLAIISAFFLGYAIFRKRYVLAGIHAVNILSTISFNGYLLMLATVAYFFLNANTNRLLRLLVLGLLLGLIGFVAFLNFDLLLPVYEAKRESVEQHSTLNIDFHWLPLIDPVQFHETWWISLIVNYFPLSVGVVLVCVWTFVQTYFVKLKSLQRLMFILFFITNLFLPFLYMFPVNFIALLFLVLYMRGIEF